MKKSTLGLLSLFIMLCTIAGNDDASQTTVRSYGEIIGKIIDQQTNETLPNTVITVEGDGTRFNTISDLHGNFNLNQIPVGTYIVRASFISYHEFELRNVVVSSDRLTQVDIEMIQSSIIIDGPIVIGYRDPLFELESGHVEVFTHEEMEKSPFRTVNETITATAGFFQTDPNQQFSVRGARPGSTVYMVDGVKMREDPGLPFSAIEQIQVITGGIPAKYGDGTGGVIVITTRNFRTHRKYRD